MEMLSYFNPQGYSSWAWSTQRNGARPSPSTNRHGTAGGSRMSPNCSNPVACSRWSFSEAVAQSQGFCPILHEDVTFGLGFTPTSCAARSGPTPGASATSAPVAPSVSPTAVRCHVRLRHEPRDPSLAEQAQPFPDRRGIRLAVSTVGVRAMGLETSVRPGMRHHQDVGGSGRCGGAAPRVCRRCRVALFRVGML